MTFTQTPPRANDNLILAMLVRRWAGETCLSIAADLGVTPSKVSTYTNRVRKADEAQEGCNLSEAYW